MKLDPANFTTRIDNPYWPMAPGDKWVYSETDTRGAKQKVVVEVTHKTKAIANGVEARVIRDTATENGEITEHTDGGRAELVSHTRGNYFTTTPNTTGAALP